MCMIYEWKTEMDLRFANHDDEGNKFGEEAFRPFKYILMWHHSLTFDFTFLPASQRPPLPQCRPRTHARPPYLQCTLPTTSS